VRSLATSAGGQGRLAPRPTGRGSGLGAGGRAAQHGPARADRLRCRQLGRPCRSCNRRAAPDVSAVCPPPPAGAAMAAQASTSRMPELEQAAWLAQYATLLMTRQQVG